MQVLSTIKIVAVGAVAALGFSTIATAGETNNLQEWASEARELLTKKMHYPVFAIQRGDEGSVAFRVRVDNEGNLLSSEIVDRGKNATVRRLGARAIEKTAWPALPQGRYDDTLLFRVSMKYQIANSLREYEALTRKTIVRGEEVAQNNGPLFSSIEILDDGE